MTADEICSASKLMHSSPLPGGSDPKSRAAVASYVKNKEEVASFLNAAPDEISERSPSDSSVLGQSCVFISPVDLMASIKHSASRRAACSSCSASP